MAFRAFYALPAENFRAASGQHTNAVYGFLSMMAKLIETRKPTHIAVAFDLGRHSFRTDEYPEYKGTRGATPEEFKGQVELIQQMLTDLGITWLTKEGYEADDILATLAHEGANAGMAVAVVSGDRDTFQLVTDEVTVLYPGMNPGDVKHMTPQVVEEKYAVPPHRYPEIAALVGETSDNLPGVPGVGAKTAAQWINAFDGLDNLLARADEIKGKRGEALREHMDDVKRNRRLNRLLTDVELPVQVGELKTGPMNRADMDALCDSLSINQLRKRLYAVHAILTGMETSAGAIGGTSGAGAGTTGAGAGASDGGADVVGSPARNLPAPLPTPHVEVYAAASDLLRAIAALQSTHGAEVALTVDGVTQAARGRIDSFCFATEETAHIFDAVMLSEPGFVEAVEDALTNIVHLTVCDWKGTWHAFAAYGVTLPTQRSFDVQLAAYLVRPEQRSYLLPDLISRTLGIDVEEQADDSSALFEIGSEAGKPTPRQESQAQLTAGALLLRRVLTQELEEAQSLDLLTIMEQPVAATLAVMESLGIAVDTEEFDRQAAELASDIARAQEAAFGIIGREVNLSSPKQLQEVLFEQLNLPKTKKTKTGYTTNAEALQDLYAKTGHEFLQHLLAHRDRTKLRQMIETLRGSVASDQRIHTTFSQVVAATGRLASSEPNLQNIPARTQDGLRIRDAFVPGAGFDALMSVDYSQIEMRIMAHLSGDQALIDAFNTGEDLHRSMASMVFNVPVSEVTGEQRSRIKATSYGLAYGLSAYGLSAQLRISVPEASDLRDRYFERFGAIRDYLAQIVIDARRDGWTQTMFGRRRYLPDLNSSNRQRREMAERAALNAPIQGSAADIIKLAMIEVAKRLSTSNLKSRMLLQIHDELLFEVVDGEATELETLVREAMATPVRMSVPLEVAVGVGKSWRLAAH